MRIIPRVWALAAGLALAAPALVAQQGGLSYPETKRIDHVDTYHGTTVPDPYRWLEDDVRTSDEVSKWVAQQNEVTFAYLESIPERDHITEALTELWNYEKFSAPFRAGDRYFYFRNDGLQNQSVIYTMESLEGEPSVLHDPNTLSDDGTVAFRGMAFSDDGLYMAYGLASAGSDWSEWRIRNVETGEDLPDLIRWVKSSGASWKKDGSGFFYGRYPEAAEGDEYQALNFNHKVYFHRLETDQREDELVYEQPDNPEWGFASTVTEDGKYLVITTWKGTDSKYLISYRSLDDPTAEFTYIIDEFANDYSFVGNDGPVFYFVTDTDALNNRLIAIDTRNPAPEHWRTIIPEAPEVLRRITLVNDKFVAQYLKDAVTSVRIFGIAGDHIRDVEFPTLGSAFGFGGERHHDETFYSFSSFAVPPSVYRYDMTTGESSLLRRAQVAFDPDDFVTEQVFYSSKDGTQVPMFITHRKGIELNGANPTLLYAYGGFNISLTPRFSVTNLMWMKMGGVYAQANLRGGGEYGKSWHEAGKKLNKQNVFDDFIAAAEWLTDAGYTRPDKLAIRGVSNGGLLVGAVLTQRPDLFGVALPAVGVMDMLRYHHFTAGRFWVDDYGSADDPEMFPYLLDYSPYHNLEAGVAYPATLVTTADTDDRVVPGHSFKFAARLQALQSGDAPVIIRIETSAGHGAGKPTTKRIEEAADILSFAAYNLNMTVEPPQP